MGSVDWDGDCDELGGGKGISMPELVKKIKSSEGLGRSG